MSSAPTLVLIHGGWHRPNCWDKIVEPLQKKHDLKCIAISLPSTSDNPNATFKDDVGVAREAITSETTQGRDVIVIGHSFGGMVSNSAIKGLTKPKSSSDSDTAEAQPESPKQGYVVLLMLIASGFTVSGYTFMDHFYGNPPPLWRPNKDTGYADIVLDPREKFYHDLPVEEGEYWVSQLRTQSLRSLYEDAEYAHAGWLDVPVWYVGTTEDKGIPVVLQRLQVGAARSLGATVRHVEMRSSHSPFLSMPDEVVGIILDAVKAVSQGSTETDRMEEAGKLSTGKVYEVPGVQSLAPSMWFNIGLPLLFGHVIGWGIAGFIGLRRLWRRT